MSFKSFLRLRVGNSLLKPFNFPSRQVKIAIRNISFLNVFDIIRNRKAGHERKPHPTRIQINDGNLNHRLESCTRGVFDNQSTLD